MIRTHTFVLIVCSVVSFTGHYMQFGILRLTPWIPATVGIITLVADHWLSDSKGLTRYAALVIIIVFGIITTNMCIRFLPQPFQPVRKKIVFSVMSLSAWITVALQMMRLFMSKDNKLDAKRQRTTKPGCHGYDHRARK